MDDNDKLILSAVHKSNQLSTDVANNISSLIAKIKDHYVPTILPDSSEPDNTKNELDNLVQELAAIRDDCKQYVSNDDTIYNIQMILTGRRESSIRMEEKVKWLTWITDALRDMLSAVCSKQALSGSLFLSGNGNMPVLNKEGYHSSYNGNISFSANGDIGEKTDRPKVGDPIPK